MEHDDSDDDRVQSEAWDDWLKSTMEWEGGIPEAASKFQDSDEPEKTPEGD